MHFPNNVPYLEYGNVPTQIPHLTKDTRRKKLPVSLTRIVNVALLVVLSALLLLLLLLLAYYYGCYGCCCCCYCCCYYC